MKSTRLVAMLLLIGSLSLGWNTATADVYKFVGRNGQVVYTDSPRHRGYKLVIKTPEREIKPVTISLGAGRKLGNGVESEERPSPKVVRGLNSPGYVPLMLSGQSQKGRSLDVRRMQYANVIERAAYKHGLDPALLHAVIQAESSYNPGVDFQQGRDGHDAAHAGYSRTVWCP